MPVLLPSSSFFLLIPLSGSLCTHPKSKTLFQLYIHVPPLRGGYLNENGIPLATDNNVLYAGDPQRHVLFLSPSSYNGIVRAMHALHSNRRRVEGKHREAGARVWIQRAKVCMALLRNPSPALPRHLTALHVLCVRFKRSRCATHATCKVRCPLATL